MKKRVAAGFAAALMLAVTLVLSGCFNELLYGTWRLSYTADEYGKNRAEDLLPVTLDIRSNGEVYMIAGSKQSLFATFTRNKNLFTLTLANPSSTGASTVTGSWVIVEGEEATELQLYLDEKPMSYILQRTTLSSTTPAAQ